MTDPHHQDLMAVDLNLLVVLDALFRHESVSAAARELSRTQSALSHALNRLREIFDDPLFVRVGNGMAPTALARSIADEVHDVTAQLHALFIRAPFEPGSIDREVHIQICPPADVTVLPSLLAAWMAHAPRLRVDIQLVPNGNLDALRKGDVDLCVAPTPTADDLYYEVIDEDAWVCIVRRAHQTVRTRLELDGYVQSRHVSWVGEPDTAIAQALTPRKLQRNVVVRAANATAAIAMCAASDLVATVPARLAAQFADAMELRVFAPPVPLGAPRTALIWAAVHQADPVHRWLRSHSPTSVG